MVRKTWKSVVPAGVVFVSTLLACEVYAIAVTIDGNDDTAGESLIIRGEGFEFGCLETETLRQMVEVAAI